MDHKRCCGKGTAYTSWRVLCGAFQRCEPFRPLGKDNGHPKCNMYVDSKIQMAPSIIVLFTRGKEQTALNNKSIM